ncbi:MAG: LamG domain-containing protein, partial [Verrucomicrobia bacterium]|nr:LamG domain-containing protein [Verrucomicrobiota bacterium]
KILAWDSGSYAKDDLRTLLDRAGHGGHGRIEGTVAVVDDDGHRVLEITGDSGYVMTDQTSLFTPPQSLAVWIKPGKLTNDWNMIATGGPWNRAWSLFLFYKQTPYNIDFRPWGRRVFTEGVVPQDKWSHLAVVDDSKTYTIYVNGEPVKTDKSSGSNWTPEGAGPLVLGTMLYYGKPKSGFCGRIGAVTMWNKALTAEEVKAETARGVQ